MIECLIEAADGHWGQDIHTKDSACGTEPFRIFRSSSLKGEGTDISQCSCSVLLRSLTFETWSSHWLLPCSRCLKRSLCFIASHCFNIIRSSNMPPLSSNQSPVSLTTLCTRHRTPPFTRAHLGVRGHGCVLRKDGCWCAWLQLPYTRYKNFPSSHRHVIQLRMKK